MVEYVIKDSKKNYSRYLLVEYLHKSRNVPAYFK